VGSLPRIGLLLVGEDTDGAAARRLDHDVGDVRQDLGQQRDGLRFQRHTPGLDDQVGAGCGVDREVIVPDGHPIVGELADDVLDP